MTKKLFFRRRKKGELGRGILGLIPLRWDFVDWDGYAGHEIETRGDGLTASEEPERDGEAGNNASVETSIPFGKKGPKKGAASMQLSSMMFAFSLFWKKSKI